MDNYYYICKKYDKSTDKKVCDYSKCPLNIKYQLNRKEYKCNRGLIEIDWAQYIIDKEMLNNEFNKATNSTTILHLIYLIKDVIKYKIMSWASEIKYLLKSDISDFY